MTASRPSHLGACIRRSEDQIRLSRCGARLRALGVRLATNLRKLNTQKQSFATGRIGAIPAGADGPCYHVIISP
jgi:hypothetical protein